MLGLASTITLGTIFGFIFIIVVLITQFSGGLDMYSIIGITVIINVFMWLISPFFTDLMYRWFYKTERLELSGLEKKSKSLASFIKKVCDKHGIKVPKLRFILDDNPTAFAFGSGAFNARLCFSEGLFTYLKEDEIEAVIGHELGHIVRRDFVIMTIASTGVQILYELSHMLMKRKGNNDKKGNAAWIGFIAYAFYFIGTYLLLFLSRAREYGADEFSAHETENPDALSRALVKIAYGIVAKPDTPEQQHLLGATRALGPYDSHAARNLGTTYENTNGDWSTVARVLAFDLVSPWAKIMQFSSTHPLTGKRIERLNTLALSMHKTTSIDINEARNVKVDRTKLYKGFASGVVVYFLPWILPFFTIIAAIGLQTNLIYLFPAALGAAFLLRVMYKYPGDTAQKVTTLDLMTDLYASPLRGTLATLEGKIIGRGDAGSKLSEDVMMQDSKGLLYLNYESVFGGIGNFFFGLTKAAKLVGKSGTMTGWFFRDISHHLDLKTMTVEHTTINSHPKLWIVIGSFILMGASVALFIVYAGAPMPF